VNEPVANSCRTCGRWPSLFDLERSTLESGAPTYDDADEYAAQTIDVEVAEPVVYDPVAPADAPPAAEPLPVPDEHEAEDAAPKPVWQRLAGFIVPIAVVVYIIISAVVNNDAG
jgi:hypothetical protein